MQSVQNQATFIMNMLLPSSGSKNKPSSAYYLLHADFLLGLFFDPED
jgi:hypothetical protein